MILLLAARVAFVVSFKLRPMDWADRSSLGIWRPWAAFDVRPPAPARLLERAFVRAAGIMQVASSQPSKHTTADGTEGCSSNKERSHGAIDDHEIAGRFSYSCVKACLLYSVARSGLVASVHPGCARKKGSTCSDLQGTRYMRTSCNVAHKTLHKYLTSMTPVGGYRYQCDSSTYWSSSLCFFIPGRYHTRPRGQSRIREFRRFLGRFAYVYIRGVIMTHMWVSFF